MTSAEQIEYWKPARLNFQNPKFKNDSTIYALEASRELAKLLGYEYLDYAFWDRIELTEELKQKLVLLASPHWKTIAAAMKIKRDEENESRLLKSD